MLIISIPKQNNSFVRTVVDGREYLLRFSWNTEGEFWTFGIWNTIDEPLVAGIKIVPFLSLTDFAYVQNIPKGVFAAVLSDKATAITKESFWTDEAQFVYFSPSELSEGSADG